jgi:sugar phosphate isomerase/epimerase
VKLAFSRPTADDAEQRLLFSRFRPAGFEGLQLKAGQYQRYLDDPERFRLDWGTDPGAPSGLIAGGTLDEAGQAALRRFIAFASAVGTERIIFCHSATRAGLTAADLRRFARVLTELGREAQAAGVRLSLHHHYGQPVMRREEFDVFFDAVEDGAVGLTVDTAHLVKSGVSDIAALIRDSRSVLDNVHLKDFADGQSRVLGEGEIDFTPVFQALREIGYDGWLCADEESGGDLLAGMEASFRFIRSRLPPVNP